VVEYYSKLNQPSIPWGIGLQLQGENLFMKPLRAALHWTLKKRHPWGRWIKYPIL
jgi:hypothetical protein